MQLPAFRRIIVEDYDQKDRALIEKLSVSLNQPLEQIIAAFSNNISVKDNLNQIQKTITVTVNSSGAPTTTPNIITGLSTQCSGIQVINAINLTNAANSPTTQPFITFSNGNGNIIINKITGLQANQNYQLTVIFYPT